MSRSSPAPAEGETPSGLPASLLGTGFSHSHHALAVFRASGRKRHLCPPFPTACGSSSARRCEGRGPEKHVAARMNPFNREARLKPALTAETAYPMTTSLSRWLKGLPRRGRGMSGASTTARRLKKACRICHDFAATPLTGYASSVSMGFALVEVGVID